MHPLTIARICADSNRALCIANGDHSRRSWDECDQDYQVSVYDLVLRTQFHLDITAETIHQLWWDDKLAKGWTLGPVLDYELKTHPCLIAFDELPEMEKAKDRLFIGIVRALS